MSILLGGSESVLLTWANFNCFNIFFLKFIHFKLPLQNHLTQQNKQNIEMVGFYLGWLYINFSPWNFHWSINVSYATVMFYWLTVATDNWRFTCRIHCTFIKRLALHLINKSLLNHIPDRNNFKILQSEADSYMRNKNLKFHK